MDDIRQASKRLKTARERDNTEYQQFVDRLDQEEKAIEKRYESLEGKKASIAQAHGNPHASKDDLIEINAGGKIIVLKRGTLCQMTGTRMEALFGGCWDKKLQRDIHGRIFLDVNSSAFQNICDYLNEMAISPSDDPPRHPTSDDCENQYIIDHLLEVFTLKNSFDSTIIINNESNNISQLHEWLMEDGVDGEFQLLYRSSRDGPSARDFHSRCDYKGCTLTIIETTGGLKLGGYSNTPWSSQGELKDSSFGANKAFLFALPGTGNQILSTRKMKLKDPKSKYATFHYDRCGPAFGNDIKVQGSKLLLRTCSYGLKSPSYEIEALTGTLPIYSTHTIKEVEVFRVRERAPMDGIEINIQGTASSNEIIETNAFSNSINDALNIKIRTLKEAELKITCLENKFNDEKNFIDLFASGKTKDVVTLNVSGTVMATERSTLLFFEDSVLARQFDDSRWTEQGRTANRVKEWTPGDVFEWAKSIDDISDDVANIFVENQITGNELLALEKDGLLMLGIERTGTLCLLLKEVKKLDKASQDVATLIEHSPYCFGKILDYLRAKRLHSKLIAEDPDLPQVRQSERKRYEKVVQYFFPGESADLIYGVRMPITIKMAINARHNPISGEISLKDGRIPRMIKLVAAVRLGHEHYLPNMWCLDVEDGTGRVEVKVSVDGGKMLHEVCGCQCYIRIIGQVINFGKKMQILATDVWPVSNGNEFTNHLVKVAQSYDKHLKTLIGGSPLNNAVIELIRNAGADGNSGVHVSHIMIDVSSQGFSEGEIWNAVTHLSSEGCIYSTLDDHYQYAE
mmetsp:Transcript_39437/g.82468  ORF Transcript_39437/g.82468 Transcript_39437/m.82468 type:complete len:799 (+) Transcript_39437:332-2728(+)